MEKKEVKEKVEYEKIYKDVYDERISKFIMAGDPAFYLKFVDDCKSIAKYIFKNREKLNKDWDLM